MKLFEFWILVIICLCVFFSCGFNRPLGPYIWDSDIFDLETAAEDRIHVLSVEMNRIHVRSSLKLHIYGARNNWRTITSFPSVLAGLTPNTTYTIGLFEVLVNGSFIDLEAATIKTFPPFPPILITNSTRTTVTLNWEWKRVQSIVHAIGYEYRKLDEDNWKQADNSSWFPIGVLKPAVIKHLRPNTGYSFRILYNLLDYIPSFSGGRHPLKWPAQHDDRFIGFTAGRRKRMLITSNCKFWQLNRVLFDSRQTNASSPRGYTCTIAWRPPPLNFTRPLIYKLQYREQMDNNETSWIKLYRGNKTDYRFDELKKDKIYHFRALFKRKGVATDTWKSKKSHVLEVNTSTKSSLSRQMKPYEWKSDILHVITVAEDQLAVDRIEISNGSSVYIQFKAANTTSQYWRTISFVQSVPSEQFRIVPKIIVGLTPNTSYTLRLSEKMVNGSLTKLEDVTIKTFPPFNPILITNATPTTLTLDWKSAGVLVDGFQYSKLDDEESRGYTAALSFFNPTPAVIKQLMPNTAYSFRISYQILAEGDRYLRRHRISIWPSQLDDRFIAFTAGSRNRTLISSNCKHWQLNLVPFDSQQINSSSPRRYTCTIAWSPPPLNWTKPLIYELQYREKLPYNVTSWKQLYEGKRTDYRFDKVKKDKIYYFRVLFSRMSDPTDQWNKKKSYVLVLNTYNTTTVKIIKHLGKKNCYNSFDNGASYRGKFNKTSGATCLAWNDLLNDDNVLSCFVGGHNNEPGPAGNYATTHNYCRNPLCTACFNPTERLPKMPWCVTGRSVGTGMEDNSRPYRWQYCNMTPC